MPAPAAGACLHSARHAATPRRQVCDTVSELAEELIDADPAENKWPEVLPFLVQMIGCGTACQRVKCPRATALTCWVTMLAAVSSSASSRTQATAAASRLRVERVKKQLQPTTAPPAATSAARSSLGPWRMR
jgi:hypothetical protein